MMRFVSPVSVLAWQTSIRWRSRLLRRKYSVSDVSPSHFGSVFSLSRSRAVVRDVATCTLWSLKPSALTVTRFLLSRSNTSNSAWSTFSSPGMAYR